MSRPLVDFVLRGVLIICLVGGLSWLATGEGASGPRRRPVGPGPLGDVFRPGAASHAKRPQPEHDVQSARELQPVLRLIARARAPLILMEPIVERADLTIAPLVALLLSDSEETARGAALTLGVLCERRGVKGDRGGTAVSLEGFEDPEVRAELHDNFALWLTRNRRAVSHWGDRRRDRLLRENWF